MNVFENAVVYSQQFELVDEREFSPEETSLISKGEVVISPKGSLQVKCSLKTGGVCFMILDKESSVQLGSNVNLSESRLRVWKRPSDGKLFNKILVK